MLAMIPIEQWLVVMGMVVTVELELRFAFEGSISSACVWLN